VRIEINKPSKRLENITAKNNRSVFSNKVATSHEERKLARFFEKLANLQNIYNIGIKNINNINVFPTKRGLGVFT